MGLGDDLRADVVANRPCPPIAPGPGHVVLTTVDHLNPHVLELVVRESGGQEATIRPTGFHKFYSRTRKTWVSAENLWQGERIATLAGQGQLVSSTRLPGTHRVYNMTVEGEHVYHVSELGVVAHNDGCGPRRPKKEIDPKIDSMEKTEHNLKDVLEDGDDDLIDRAARSEETMRRSQNRRRRQERRFRNGEEFNPDGTQ